MSQALIYTLLALALVAPVFGALALRFLLSKRLSEPQVNRSAAVLFAIAIISVFMLAFSNVEKLSVGNLEILLPFTGAVSATAPDLAMPVVLPEQPPVTTAPPATVPAPSPPATVTPDVTASANVTTTATVTPTATLATTATVTTTATVATTATVTTTATLETTATAATTATATQTTTATPTLIAPTEPPSPTPEPPSPTPEPPTPEPAAPRTYTVQPGDTLRSIAAQFDVEVEALLAANDLTPAQGDALRVGQELIIP